MIRIFSYSKTSTRMETPGIAELPQHLADSDRVVWVDLEAPDDEEVGVLGGIFGFHVLAAEDCINGHYWPKIDVYDAYHFLVLHAVDLPELETRFQPIEVGFFLGERFLVTHHDKQVKGIFDARGQVAKNPGSLLRSPDWLLHGIVDAMVDHYALALNALDARIAQVETEWTGAFDRIRALRIELSHLCRLGRLQQDVLARLMQGDLSWINEAHRIYFQNVHAHMARAVQTADLYRDRVEAALSAGAALAREQQARALGLLATVGAVFVPLLLIGQLFDLDLGGVLGLTKPLVVALDVGLMAVVGVSLFGILRWKRWF